MINKTRAFNALAQSLYTLLARIAVDPNEPPEVGLKKAILLGAHLLLIPFVLSMTCFYAYLVGTVSILGVGIGYVMWCLLIVFVLPRWQKNVQWWGNIAGVGLLTFIFSLTFMLGGLENSGQALPFFGLANPLVSLLNLKPRNSLIWLLIHIGSILLTLVLQPYMPAYHIAPAALGITFAINSIGSAIFYFCIFFYFIKQRDEAFRLLNLEQEKSEGLLLNILPREVARILKNEQRLIAEHFPSASVLFADVVSFTPLSATLPPTELVLLLNEVFSYFDTLVEKYGAEKIKTIGDCYMVAVGVPRPCSNHAKILAHLALDIHHYARHHTFHGQPLAFRIGINSGPVTAGVIGHKKFAYDLWGDAVNTASRMEAHGTSGIIQVTEATYHLLKDEFICEPQGAIQVKGKGEMKVWHVIRPRD